MRKRLLLVMSILAMSLAGCSSSSDKGVLEVKDGVIYNNGVATTAVTHTGQKATEPFSLNPNLTIEWSWHNAFGDCDHNPSGVAINNVTKSERDKSISYFSAYGGSQFTIHKEVNGYMICGYLYSPEALQADVAINQLTNTIQNLVMSTDYKAARIGLIEVHDWPDILVTQTSIEVPGCFTIKEGNVATNETKEFNKQSVGYLNDSVYDYYQYGEYVIQAMKGYDISQCIRFLKG